MTRTVCILAFIVAVGVGSALAICLPGYTEVTSDAGNKCYTVPGIPQRISWYSAYELCSVAQGNLFHVNNITQWNALNDFLVGLNYQDTYWTGVAAEGHPGQWVIRDTGFELNPAAVEFKEGAPSNSADKLCLAIEYQSALGRYQWVDLACSERAVIVCEFKTCRTGN